MIKAILFDLDNTLLDFMELKKRSCDAAIRAMIKAGLRLEKKEATCILFDLYKAVGIENSRIFQKFLKKTIGSIDMRILTAGIVAYRRVQAGHRNPYPGVVNVLKKLKKKYRLGIVSDAPSLKAWLRLTEFGLVEYFDVVVAFDDTGKKKPSSLPFQKAISALGMKPEEIMYVGDVPQRDIVGAKKLGMSTVLARYGIQKQFLKDLKKIRADYTIDDIREILKILQPSS